MDLTMSTEIALLQRAGRATGRLWRRLTGRSLVCAWLLWQAAAPMLPNAPHEGAVVLKSYDTWDDCLKAATTKRAIRNVIIHKGQSAMEVFACLPEGADPARASFE
jgi:hypothetical protein